MGNQSSGLWAGMKKPPEIRGRAKAVRCGTVNCGYSCCITSQEDRGTAERQQHSNLHEFSVSGLLVVRHDAVRDLVSYDDAADFGVTPEIPRLHNDVSTGFDLRLHLARATEQ